MEIKALFWGGRRTDYSCSYIWETAHSLQHLNLWTSAEFPLTISWINNANIILKHCFNISYRHSYGRYLSHFYQIFYYIIVVGNYYYYCKIFLYYMLLQIYIKTCARLRTHVQSKLIYCTCSIVISLPEKKRKN